MQHINDKQSFSTVHSEWILSYRPMRDNTRKRGLNCAFTVPHMPSFYTQTHKQVQYVWRINGRKCLLKHAFWKSGSGKLCWKTACQMERAINFHKPIEPMCGDYMACFALLGAFA